MKKYSNIDKLIGLVGIGIIIYFIFREVKVPQISSESQNKISETVVEDRETTFILKPGTIIYKDTINTQYYYVNLDDKLEVNIRNYNNSRWGYYKIIYKGSRYYVHSKNLKKYDNIEPTVSNKVSKRVVYEPVKGAGGFLFGMSSDEVITECNSRGFIFNRSIDRTPRILVKQYDDVSIGGEHFDALVLAILDDELYKIDYFRKIPPLSFVQEDTEGLNKSYEQIKSVLREKYGEGEEIYGYDVNETRLQLPGLNLTTDWRLGTTNIILHKHYIEHELYIQLTYSDLNKDKEATNNLNNFTRTEMERKQSEF